MENIAELFGQMWDIAKEKAQQAVEDTAASDCSEEENRAINALRIETAREAYLKMMVDMHNVDSQRGMLNGL